MPLKLYDFESSSMSALSFPSAAASLPEDALQLGSQDVAR
jgi:hypothetical protein